MGTIKRGAFFSTDALVAIILIFFIIIALYPLYQHSLSKTEAHYDIITVLSSLKIGEVQNPYVQGLIADGRISDPNSTLLEQIGDFYVSDLPTAKALAKEMLSSLDTKRNIGIWYGNDLLASKNSSEYESAKNVDVARQTISGIQKGSPVTGYVAKAWLKKILKKKTLSITQGDLMCGAWNEATRYCGVVSTNASYRFEIPSNATIQSVTWFAEPSWQNQVTTLIINDQQVFHGNIQFYAIINLTNHVVHGNNTATVRGATGADDGASHIIVEYTTPDLQTYSFSKEFPFNEIRALGVLYHEKAIFIPSTIHNISISINTTSPVNLSLVKGASATLIGTKSPIAGRVNFTDSEIRTALSSNSISYANLSNEYFILTARVGTANQPAFIGTNSLIYINYSEIPIPFGSIDLTQNISVANFSSLYGGTFYRYVLWKFHIPQRAAPILANWQLGWAAGPIGTTARQDIRANGIPLYQSPPQPYIQAISRYGYTPQKATGVFKEGENNFSMNFTGDYSVSTEVSYGAVTYFVNSYVNYGSTKEKAVGGTRTVEFEYSPPQQITIGSSADPWDPNIDAIDDAVDRLLSQLDADADGKLDLIIDQNNLEIDSLDISGVPYLWSTEVQVRVWD